MEHFIKYVNIHNFKSIADLKLEDCRRINLFIGYPNVGKSNVLEALGLFSISFLDETENLNKLVRAENKNELFYNAIVKTSEIETDLSRISLFNDTPKLRIFQDEWNNCINYLFTSTLDLYSTMTDSNPAWVPERKTIPPEIRKYSFQPKIQWKPDDRFSFDEFDESLLPPFGENIIGVLSNNPNVSDVKAWMKQEFAKFGLEYVLDKSSNSLKMQRRLGNDEVFQLPYSSLADTLQRVIFYKTAIASNKNSVLLFEEPEAHAFPPYISTLMQDVIEAESNQFFIVTHSPIIVNAFLEYEHLRRETSIYLFDYKNDQTTVKRLSDEEMDEVYEYGEDLFWGIEKFLDEEYGI